MVLIPTPIYHITHISNLASILECDGLYSKTLTQRKRVIYKNIAFQDIQSRRSWTKVPCSPFGNLHDYVPFYFAPRSPMLYTINMGNVPEHAEDQVPIIHLYSTVQQVVQSNLPFVFTDGHGTMKYTHFFNQLRDLDKVDWRVMESKYWNDTDDDPDRKRRRQAEFLINNFFPFRLFLSIGVVNLNYSYHDTEKPVTSIPSRGISKIIASPIK